MPVKRDSIVRLFPSLGELLRDPGVQRIFVDAPDRVYLERDGRLTREDIKWTAAEVTSAIRALSGPMGANAAKTGFSVVKDGVRVSGYPVAGETQQVALVFECGLRPGVDLGELVRRDALTKAAAAFLTLALRAGANIGVVGRPGLSRDRWVSALLDAMPYGARIGQIGALDPASGRGDVIQLSAPRTTGSKRLVEQLFEAATSMRLDRVAIGGLSGTRIALVRQLSARTVPVLIALTGDTPGDAILRLAAQARADEALGPEVDSLVAASFDLLVGVGRGQAGQIDWIDSMSIEDGVAVTERLFERGQLAGPLEERDGTAALWMRWESWVMQPVGRVSRNVVSSAPMPASAMARPSNPGIGRGTVEIREPKEHAPLSGPITGGAIDDRPTRIDVIADPPPKGRARSYSDILRSVDVDEDEGEGEPQQKSAGDDRVSKPLPRLRAPKSRDS